MEKKRHQFFNLGRLQFAPPMCRAKTTSGASCGTEMADCGRLDEQVAAKNNPEAGHACCPFRLIDSQPVGIGNSRRQVQCVCLSTHSISTRRVAYNILRQSAADPPNMGRARSTPCFPERGLRSRDAIILRAPTCFFLTRRRSIGRCPFVYFFKNQIPQARKLKGGAASTILSMCVRTLANRKVRDLTPCHNSK